MTRAEQWSPWIIGVLTIYLLFWNLGTTPVGQWDEARYGVNAFEMARSGDYINYTYNGRPDLWNAKPPLQVWTILATSKLFGFNEFSLRFPSAIGGLITLIFIYFIGFHFGGARLGWFSVLIAATMKALIGPHVARTGDMDALFVAGLTLTAFAFISATENGRRKAWLACALGLGIAFLAKGFTFLMILPGLAYLSYRLGLKRILKERTFWLGSLVFLLFPIAWLITVQLCGFKDPSQKYQSTNSFGVMIFYDIFARFFGTMDNEKPPLQAEAIFAYMDIRFLAWYYWVILGGIAIAFWRRFFEQSETQQSFLFQSAAHRKEAVRFALVWALPIILLVTFSRHKNDWYIAPLAIVWPLFVAALLDQVLISGHKKFRHVMVGAFTLCLAINTYSLVEYVTVSGLKPSLIQTFARENKSQLRDKTVTVNRRVRQDELLYLLWAGVSRVRNTDDDRGNPPSYELNCNANDCRLAGPP